MNVKRLRESTGMTQADFWNRVFCLQSGGCRYESGRRIPKPVQALLTIAYGKPSDAAKLFKALREK